MKTDILRLVKVGLKKDIQANDLYVDEEGNVFRCGNPERNNREGWPDDGKLFKIIPVLEKTDLNMSEIEDLKNIVYKHKLRDGELININYSFSK